MTQFFILMRMARLFCVFISFSLAIIVFAKGDNERPSPILDSQTVTINQAKFNVLTVNPKLMRLHWKNPNTDKAFTYFSSLKNHLKQNKTNVIALMNAGIYSDNNRPSGLHIEQGKTFKSLNTKKGRGNFHLQPNGVFYITKQHRANILSTSAFKKYFKPPYQNIRLATQSGPMLLINGKVNPIFRPSSTSLYNRNGICINKQRQVKWIASKGNKSNLYTFAKAMQKASCWRGLYLDGNISKLYQANKNYILHFWPFVGILSITQPLN